MHSMSVCNSVDIVSSKIISGIGDELTDHTNIPAHLLGNMWGQSWSNLYDDTKPFKNATAVDVTRKLHEQKYTPLKMFELSDEFYQSLGLESNHMSYTGESIIEKPAGRIIQCHASAWDFHNGKDYRIKMCTNVNQEDLITIHHEMGLFCTTIYSSILFYLWCQFLVFAKEHKNNGY